MKDWKKRWQNELDAIVPSIREDVKNEPIPAAPFTHEKNGTSKKETIAAWLGRLFASPRRIVAFASACAVFVLSLGLSLFFGLSPKGDGGSLTMGAVYVQINPCAVFSVDEDGNVLHVAAMNADADVILSNDHQTARLQGQPVANAVKTFTDEAARLGYLDLNATGAMRVTSSAGEVNTQIIKECLEGYFCEKGSYIVVADELVTDIVLAERLGLTAADMKNGLMAAIESLANPYFIRVTQNQSDERLEELYYEQVDKAGIESSYESLLRKHVGLIRQNIADVQAIVEKEEEIRLHKDNPMWGLLDFWTLHKYFADEELSTELVAESKQMQEMLLAYEKTYGKCIGNIVELQETVRACNAQPLETLTMILENFTSEVFTRHLSYLTDLLKNVGIDVAWLADAYQVPADAQAYVLKMQNYVNARYQDLQSLYLEKYEEPRKQLDGAEYRDYVMELTQKYGSLENYWASLQK